MPSEIAGTLKRAGGSATKMASSRSQSVSPAEGQPDLSTYSGRVAARIRKLRKARGMTVDALAQAVTQAGYPVAKMTLYHWENGGRDPHLDALPYVAKALGAKLPDLMPAK